MVREKERKYDSDRTGRKEMNSDVLIRGKAGWRRGGRRR